MQDPAPNPNPDHSISNNNAATSNTHLPPPPPPPSASTRPHHRRAHSELTFRFPDDIMDLSSSDPFNSGSAALALDEIGSEDDLLFSTFIDVDKLGTGTSANFEAQNQNNPRPRHRYSSSVDGSASTSVFGDVLDAKKAMPPDKLAELWTLDPKRAKRILANRQSAVRSKERKSRYIQELEHKVRTLQTEATTLSAQLTLFQRDTTGLGTENTELKFRLQAMEQQAHLRDALNDALKKEVERIKVATGETSNGSDFFNLGIMPHMPYLASSFFPLHQQPVLASTQNMQLPSNMSMHPLHHQSNTHRFVDTVQSDPLGRLQGLDIRSNRSPLVKPDVPSLSASETSATF